MIGQEYEGVLSRRYIQPMTLAKQDIVITTYDVLRRELKATNVLHTNSHVGRRLRNPKKFLALPSPLTSVQWWRVCRRFKPLWRFLAFTDFLTNWMFRIFINIIYKFYVCVTPRNYKYEQERKLELAKLAKLSTPVLNNKNSWLVFLVCL